MKFAPTHKVTVYRETPGASANDDGQVPETESKYCERWAEIKVISPTAGTEAMQASQQQADIVWLVRMVSDSIVRTITHEMWLKLDDGTRLDIQGSFDPNMRREYHTLKCNQRA